MMKMMHKSLATLTLWLAVALVPPMAWAAEGPYMALEPPFVVNLQGEGRARYMQVKVQVMSHNPAVMAAIQEHMPPIRHAMIMLLAHQDAKTMYDVQGREQVRQEALATLRRVLKEQAGIDENTTDEEGNPLPGLEAVYFTDFVIQ